QDLVAALDHPSRVRGPHLRGPQRTEVHPGVRHREHGGPQARRVLTHPDLHRPLGGEEGGQATSGREVRETMESRAHLRNFRMAVVGDLVRGKPVGAALNILRFTKRAAAKPVAKLIQSAVANATDLSKGQVDVDALYVKTISVDQGSTLRRFMPRAMGRATRIHHKSSHVSVVLADTPVRRRARS